MAETIIELLAEYTLTLKNEPVRDEVRLKAKDFFADTVACMIAGCRETPVRILADYYKDKSKGGATAAGYDGLTFRPEDAACINGTAAHFHDYDDVMTTMIGHPSVAVLPAALAAGEMMSSSGEEVLKAYIAGIEICALMGRCFIPELCRNGFHSTPVIGVFGATAAAGYLMGLNEEELVNAFGIAASESSGLKGNTGTMTKPLHAGRAASKGIMAAELASRGFTSNKNIMEMESGWIMATTRECHLEKMKKAMKERNSEFLNVGLIMKPWPACKATHNAVWALLVLMDKYGISADMIEKIDCRVLPYAGDILRYSVVDTPTQGKFSMNYVIAVIALRKKLTMKDFEGDEVTDPEIIAMEKKVTMILDDSLMPGCYFHDLESSSVDVYLKDKRMFSERCDYAKGGPMNSMTDEEKYEKWSDCIKRTMAEDRTDEIIQAITAPEKFDDISGLMQIIR